METSAKMRAEQNFMNIGTADCVRVSREILMRSDRKFEESEILAASGRFDTATSLLIISNEELLKSAILFMDGHRFKFRSVKGMKNLFTNHKMRYLFAMVLSMVSIAADDLVALLQRIILNPNELRDFRFDAPGFEKKVARYFMRKIVQMKEEIRFFSRVDRTRQVGFYSDYNDGILQVSEVDYNIFHFKLSRIRGFVKTQMEMMELQDAELDKSLEELRDEWEKDKIYLALEKLIEKINKPGVNSYDDLQSAIDDLWNDFKSQEFKPFADIVERYRNKEKKDE